MRYSDNKKLDDNFLDFIGIGAAKSGTTWLVECLNDHPEIFIPYIKEIAFFNKSEFNKKYLKGMGWYKSFFEDAPENTKIGEFTTHYMLFKDAAELIYKHFPDIKLIACLRNPADMLYSFYWWKKSHFDVNEMPETFEDAFDDDPIYKKRGKYFEQLKRYYDVFPKENIKVILFDDIKDDSIGVLKEIYDYLGVSTDFTPEHLDKKVNRTGKVRSKFLAKVIRHIVYIFRFLNINTVLRSLYAHPFFGKVYSMIMHKEFSYPPLSKETRRKLTDFFEEDISKLEKLIDKDLSSWKRI